MTITIILLLCRVPGTVTLTGSSDIWSSAHSSFEFTCMLKQNQPTKNSHLSNVHTHISQHLHVVPYLLHLLSQHTKTFLV